jgi:hypothetical protein
VDDRALYSCNRRKLRDMLRLRENSTGRSGAALRRFRIRQATWMPRSSEVGGRRALSHLPRAIDPSSGASRDVLVLRYPPCRAL